MDLGFLVIDVFYHFMRKILLSVAGAKGKSCANGGASSLLARLEVCFHATYL